MVLFLYKWGYGFQEQCSRLITQMFREQKVSEVYKLISIYWPFQRNKTTNKACLPFYFLTCVSTAKIWQLGFTKAGNALPDSLHTILKYFFLIILEEMTVWNLCRKIVTIDQLIICLLFSHQFRWMTVPVWTKQLLFKQLSQLLLSFIQLKSHYIHRRQKYNTIYCPLFSQFLDFHKCYA